jgi:hypothetical protein
MNSVDYFLLDSSEVTPNGTVTNTNTNAATEPLTNRNALTNVEEEVVATSPEPHGTKKFNSSTNSTCSNGNRCRLESNHTNTSISLSHDENQYHHKRCNEGTGSVVERIYFEDHHHHRINNETLTVPSTTQLERGESSYSLLLSHCSPTTPFLVSSPSSDPIHLETTATTANNASTSSRRGTATTTTRHSCSNHRRRTLSNSEYYYSQQQQRRNSEKPELSGLNLLNAFTYTIHILLWWTCGVWGIRHRIYTHFEQTEHHETLLTPATFCAHYIWVPIMIFEAIFTIAQLLPHYRARPIITSGTSYFFFYTVLLQIAYTLLYGFGLFVFSFICIVLALISLLSLLASQQYHGSADPIATSTTTATTPYSHHNHHQYQLGFMRTLSGGNIGNGRWFSSHRMMEYVLFSFPFYLHAGWLILMAVEHFCLLFRRYHSAIDAQLASDIVGLGILLATAIYALNQPIAMGPDFVIPTVILWSYVRRIHTYLCVCLLVRARYFIHSFPIIHGCLA